MKNALKGKIEKRSYEKLMAIDNPGLHQFIAKYVELCNPDRVFVCTDSAEDIGYIREAAMRNGEETKLAIDGHTVHFDNYRDQARDREHTKILVPPGVDLRPIETMGREEGLRDIRDILKNIMKGQEMYVRFFSLGPLGSDFSVLCVQLTDSAYVAHNEDLLYRHAYEEFRKQGPSAKFFKFVHSQGALDERKTSKNLDKRRVYIDLHDDTVYSVNTQYGGNTIGLKKLAMRLAIKHASEEGWLCEHMLILGVHGPKGRVTYFTGAFPSLCGKTSTAMLDGETIVGDDIAYLRRKGGEVRAVNVERGIFGIIQEINSKDDPLLWKALNSPGEVIFSNVLVTEDGRVHWIGKDGKAPKRGFNHSGEWWVGKRDAKGKEIPCSHPNARFTLDMKILDNLDPKLDDPEGVVVGGIVYGGRDSDTSVPVKESFDWVHGIVTKGASLESERTAAVLGEEGAREFNPMSNLDFLSIPIGRYIQDNLEFSIGLKNPPLIFGVNYFLKDKATGKFLNEVSDKKVWYKWMELRAHREVGAIRTPTGLIPEYEDLKKLFKEVLGKEYSKDGYVKQFTLRIPEHLARVDRIMKIYRKIPGTPEAVFKVLEEQRQRLIEARKKYGDYVTPDKFSRGTRKVV